MKLRDCIMLSYRMVVVFIIIVMFTGCMHQPYPERWAPLVTKLEPDGCKGLSGTYRDWPIGLFDLITNYGGYKRDFDFVKIDSAQSGFLTFEAYKDGKLMKDFNVSEKEETLICQENGADLPMSGVYGAQEVLVVSKKKLILRKDISGNLIVMNDETGIGFYGPIPLPGSEKHWYRFIPYSNR